MKVNTFLIAKEFLFEFCELWETPIILFMDNLKGMPFNHYFHNKYPFILENTQWEKS